MSGPQLQRDLREVENELRLVRNRRDFYYSLDELELARHTMNVVCGLETLQQTLTSRLQALHEKTH